jgi:hypothetical protein
MLKSAINLEKETKNYLPPSKKTTDPMSTGELKKFGIIRGLVVFLFASEGTVKVFRSSIVKFLIELELIRAIFRSCKFFL